VSEIGFYHLTRTPMEQALPRLLGRVLSTGGRAFVLCGEPERAPALDAALWLSTDPDWLPHAMAGGEDDALQPILIGTQDTPPGNNARFLVQVAGANSQRLDAYDRILDLFDGTDDTAVAAARTRWTTAKTAGHTLTYWQQGSGGWERKGLGREG
jgi:DNA polymerase-3 subunit chi